MNLVSPASAAPRGIREYKVYYRDWENTEREPYLVATLYLAGDDIMANCEEIFKMLNMDDRINRRTHRSMSVGDFVIIEGNQRALCRPIGFVIRDWSLSFGLIPEEEPRDMIDIMGGNY